MTIEELAKRLEMPLKIIRERLNFKDPNAPLVVMQWRDATMLEAFEHARYRDIDPDKRLEGTSFDEATVVFTDGTAVACYSRWKGPYSEVTPDIDACDPGWRIFS